MSKFAVLFVFITLLAVSQAIAQCDKSVFRGSSFIFASCLAFNEESFGDADFFVAGNGMKELQSAVDERCKPAGSEGSPHVSMLTLLDGGKRLLITMWPRISNPTAEAYHFDGVKFTEWTKSEHQEKCSPFRKKNLEYWNDFVLNGKKDSSKCVGASRVQHRWHDYVEGEQIILDYKPEIDDGDYVYANKTNYNGYSSITPLTFYLHKDGKPDCEIIVMKGGMPYPFAKVASDETIVKLKNSWKKPKPFDAGNVTKVDTTEDRAEKPTESTTKPTKAPTEPHEPATEKTNPSSGASVQPSIASPTSLSPIIAPPGEDKSGKRENENDDGEEHENVTPHQEQPKESNHTATFIFMLIVSVVGAVVSGLLAVFTYRGMIFNAKKR